ncbi:hypothetical protein KIPB_011002 [Kipferlia bialata]|uniref:Uncharacterized protein n=1 Tax=Kipferlia bialata TaxID=797122 RepID=A0A9K3GN01_9EUKA|nr:hypothetical protein KIPB_011002 [Kipferlia bialata]|eukprot:g11002.t1
MQISVSPCTTPTKQSRSGRPSLSPSVPPPGSPVTRPFTTCTFSPELCADRAVCTAEPRITPAMLTDGEIRLFQVLRDVVAAEHQRRQTAQEEGQIVLRVAGGWVR